MIARYKLEGRLDQPYKTAPFNFHKERKKEHEEDRHYQA